MEGWLASIRERGHVFVPADTMRAVLESKGSLSDLQFFSESWDRLQVDTYMADQGRYRRRRHAVYGADAAGLKREPHQAHYQSVEYNPLNGGIARWFEPIEDRIGASVSMTTILEQCRTLFSDLASESRWKIETHQFRIEATAGMKGQPTPEGIHRDGVDYVLVLLMRRHNIASGTTLIHTPQGESLGSFTLTHPLDAVLLDDTRVAHGVTPVEPLDPNAPAYRDVLVVTFKKR